MLSKFYAFVDGVRADLEGLKSRIESNKKELAEAEKAYKKALSDGMDAEADDIYSEIEGLKERIKRDSYRLQVKESMQGDNVREKALEAMDSFADLQKEAQARLDKLDQKISGLLDEVDAVMTKADIVKADYEGEKYTYERLIEKYNLDHRELAKKGIRAGNGLIYNKVEAFRTNQGRLPMQANPKSKATSREERLNELPKGASIADIAKASRLIGE